MPGTVPLFHRDFGGSGPPLVILHGMLGSSRNWQAAGKDLAAAGFHVLVPDLRNHGQSPHAPEMGYESIAGDVLAWLDQLGLAQVQLMGHSMGGKAAMLLACRHPDRFTTFKAVDIAPKSYRWAAHRLEFAAMEALDLEHLASRADAELQMEGRVPDWAMRKFLTTNLERNDPDAGPGWRWTVNLPVIGAALAELEANPLRPDDRYDGPARFIAGGKSRYLTPAADLPAIKQHFPLADLIVIPESGHNPHFETRPEFLAAVVQPAAN
jgi:pimeloyl-ACP methyl ester carboxylesterase